MLRTPLSCISLLLIAGCASLEAGEPIDPMQYGCKDLVVVGRVAALASTPINPINDDGVSWSSVWDYKVTIERVIRGAERKAVVRAVGASHAQVREDIDLLIVLSKNKASPTYSIRTLNVWESKSQLAKNCTNMTD